MAERTRKIKLNWHLTHDCPECGVLMSCHPSSNFHKICTTCGNIYKMSGNGKLCYHSNNRQFIKKKKRPQKKLGGNKIDAKIDIDEKINRLFDASLLAMEDGNYELAAQLRDRAEELRKKSTNSAILRGSIKKKVKKKVKKFKKKTSYWNCD